MARLSARRSKWGATVPVVILAGVVGVGLGFGVPEPQGCGGAAVDESMDPAVVVRDVKDAPYQVAKQQGEVRDEIKPVAPAELPATAPLPSNLREMVIAMPEGQSDADGAALLQKHGLVEVHRFGNLRRVQLADPGAREDVTTALKADGVDVK